jgi:hypothetical protein
MTYSVLSITSVLLVVWNIKFEASFGVHVVNRFDRIYVFGLQSISQIVNYLCYFKTVISE